MHRFTTKFVASLMAVLAIFAAGTTTHSQDVLNSCSADIKKYCSQVTLGNGRLLACMYAHEDKISDQCDMAIADAADQLDWFLDRVRTAIAQCAPDIEKHCADVAAGQGRIFVCLRSKKSQLNDDCITVVDRVSERLALK